MVYFLFYSPPAITYTYFALQKDGDRIENRNVIINPLSWGRSGVVEMSKEPSSPQHKKMRTDEHCQTTFDFKTLGIMNKKN